MDSAPMRFFTPADGTSETRSRTSGASQASLVVVRPGMSRSTPSGAAEYERSRYRGGGLSTRSFVAAAALHAAALAILLGTGGIPLDKPKRERLTVFDVASPPQPAPPPAEPVPVVAPPVTVAKPRVELPAPTPRLTATPETATVVSLAPPVGGPPAPALEAPPAPAAPITPPDFSAAQLNNPGPRYPYLSRRNHEEGTVLLKVLVTPGGKAGEVLLHKSSGFQRLDDAAMKTVRRWRFVPAQQAGKAVAAWVLVPVGFAIG